MTTMLRTSELETGASRLAPTELIRRKALNEISAYWNTCERSNWARRLKRLTADAVHEYEDRFLIELIQNGYDAHAPGTRDGMVAAGRPHPVERSPIPGFRCGRCWWSSLPTGSDFERASRARQASCRGRVVPCP